MYLALSIQLPSELFHFRLQGLSLRGPPSNEDDRLLSVGDLQPSDSQNNESSQDTTSRVKTFAHLTANPLLTKAQKAQLGQNQFHYQDIRFFAELVKPLQYRLRRKKDKVITPSKYGYHPRSQSPTFKRLVAATEKLEIISENDAMIEKNKAMMEDSRTIKSWQSSRRHLTSLNFQNITVSEPYSITSDSDLNTPKTTNNSMLEIPGEYPPRGAIEEEENDISEDETDFENNRSETYFKVDFKVEESHASLRLFLPHINGSIERSETDASDEKPDVSPLKLPPLVSNGSDNLQNKNPGTIRRAFRRNVPLVKRRRRRIERCPSATDSEHSVRDHLNDVSTLISLESHKCRSRKNSICPFENCPYHMKLPDET